MENTIHDPQKWLEEKNQEWSIFQYDYQFSMKDKIYVSTLRNKSIKDLCVGSSDRINSTLAGDIQDEFRVNSSEAILAMEEELKWHMSNILNTNITSISLTNPEDLTTSLWVNYQKKNEYNPQHAHNGQFSFVFYSSIPETIRQEHKQSVGNSETRGLIQFNSELVNSIMLFNPSEDTILIFESSHYHQVYPFYSNETRISVAGNIFNLG